MLDPQGILKIQKLKNLYNISQNENVGGANGSMNIFETTTVSSSPSSVTLPLKYKLLAQKDRMERISSAH